MGVVAHVGDSNAYLTVEVDTVKAVSSDAKTVLDNLTTGLQLGEARKVDRTPGAFLPVYVEYLEDTRFGAVYSVAHYYEQNGDHVPDPEMTFFCGADGSWYPLTFQNATAYRTGAQLEPDGTIALFPREQADQAAFAELWMRNVRASRGSERLTLPTATPRRLPLLDRLVLVADLARLAVRADPVLLPDFEARLHQRGSDNGNLHSLPSVAIHIDSRDPRSIRHG